MQSRLKDSNVENEIETETLSAGRMRMAILRGETSRLYSCKERVGTEMYVAVWVDEEDSMPICICRTRRQRKSLCRNRCTVSSGRGSEKGTSTAIMSLG